MFCPARARPSRKPVELNFLRMSHGVLDDDGIDYKTIASQHIEPFLHDLGKDCKKHPSVTFVSTTPGDIRRDPRTKSAIHRLSASIAALEEAETLIRQARLVAEEELGLLRARVAPISACPNEIIAKILVLTYSSVLMEAGEPTRTLLQISRVRSLLSSTDIVRKLYQPFFLCNRCLDYGEPWRSV
jgi:hypothetical protein